MTGQTQNGKVSKERSLIVVARLRTVRSCATMLTREQSLSHNEA
jgi:hypothetical protein